MKPLDISLIRSLGLSIADIEEAIKHTSPFVLQVPLPSVNFSQSYLDIISDYLEASFLAEELANHSQDIQVKEIWGVKHHPVYHFSIWSVAIERLAEKIFELSILFGYEDDEEDEFVWWRETVFEFRETLDQRTFVCPEIIDDFYANLINGAYFELESESPSIVDRELKKYPERRFGFWKTAFSPKIGHDCYVSVDVWIAPIEVDIVSLIRVISGHVGNIIFEQAQPLIVNQTAYLVGKDQLIYMPFGHFMKAKMCAGLVLDRDGFGIDFDWIENLFTYASFHEDTERDYPEYYKYLPSGCDFYVSDYGHWALVQDQKFSYLLFDSQSLDEKQKIELASSISEIFSGINHLSGVHENIDCPWHLLDDEQFEQLCYDVIYHDPKFDHSTIRKMGKSRSRDGGRDIEVYTRPRPGYRSEKYVFQCKLIDSKSSLSGSKIVGISDVIDQFGALGYGVMTSGVIDPTLFDKLDGIARNRDIQIQHWSVYELERFLAKNPNIMKRYFG